jgi:hypothetical protein
MGPHLSQQRVHPPSTLFYMPPYDSALPGDPVGHPHVVAVDAVPASTCTLIYGSTKEAERAAGAQFHRVRPRKYGVGANGLGRVTFIYPGVICRRDYDEIPAEPRHGWLGAEMNAIRTKLNLALGIGKGCVGEPGHSPRSLRGSIVELTRFAARVAGTRVAVLVTEPRYSHEKNYQVIVPVVDAPAGPAVPPVFEIPEVPWFKPSSDEHRAYLLVPATVSVRHEDHIKRVTGHVIEKAIMDDLDNALCSFFGLRET